MCIFLLLEKLFYLNLWDRQDNQCYLALSIENMTNGMRFVGIRLRYYRNIQQHNRIYHHLELLICELMADMKYNQLLVVQYILNTSNGKSGTRRHYFHNSVKHKDTVLQLGLILG